MKTVNVNFKKLSENAVVPFKAHPTDAGFDMVATKVNMTDDYVEYETDIAIKLPSGYCAMLFPRSSNSNKDLVLSNSVGIIDENYVGPIKWRFKRIRKPTKLGISRIKFVRWVYDIQIKHPELKTYNVGDKIGQMVIMPVYPVEFQEVDKLPETDRGDGGFGSTDAKVAPVESKAKSKSTKTTRKKKTE